MVEAAGAAAPQDLPPIGEVTRLTPELAQRYMDAEPGTLAFYGVTELDPKTAEVLAKHPPGISLPGIQKLPPEVVRVLAESRFPLALDGIRVLDPVTTDILANSDARLSLAGLQDLTSPKLARKLGQQIGVVSLPNIAKVDKAIADELSAGPVKLVMPGLHTLTHGGLASRLVGAAPAVDLPVVTDFNAEAAQGLCTGECDVYMPSLDKLDDATAKALSNHAGVIQMYSLQQISPEGIESLLGNDGPLSIGAVQIGAAGKQIPGGVLQALAAHAWPLSLGLKEIPPALADAIKKRQASVSLGGVEALTTSLAQSLVGCQCVVWLTNVERIEQGAAGILLQHRGPGGQVTGFVLPVTARQLLLPWELKAMEKHECIFFGNLLDKRP